MSIKYIQRDIIAIININDLKNELKDHYHAFILNYKDAIRYANDSVIIRCCDLESLIINYISNSFTTYYQDQSIIK